ncbi:MAG: hydantoinase/oxoprolinase family protein [Alphaproteobacteria bacterium]|nr:hydantoinase/oxoprolinase family protein [Alphaproteobacteria bacterium]
MTSYLIGVDIGGTFTDCVIVGDDGDITTAKAPSTPGDYSQGVLNSMSVAADQLGFSLEEICRSTRLLTHGTTIGTNAVIQKRGAKVGIITTRGHNDVIHIMRGSRGLTGRDISKIIHFPESSKPEPLVAKSLIEGVSERVDYAGEVVVPLHEGEVRKAIDRLLAAGVEAIAICFLWSFKRPQHELRVKAMLAEIAPQIFVTCSSDLVPRWGEYERLTATVLNSYIGPLTAGYLLRLDQKFKDLGYGYPLQVVQCGGGTISVERAVQAPLLTLDSGPVAGVTGSKYLGQIIGYPNIITTDMGGTSFDVGLIIDGEPAASSLGLVNQYEYFLPNVDIQTIGAGGGSLVNVDRKNGLIKVGPQSAGAKPGPVCYGRGGTQATVTDAALVLGYISPDKFASGTMKLDKERAEGVIADIATSLNMTPMACAAGIVRIAEFQMADLIRKATVQRGIDPRDFVVFAFGGAGPMHAGVYAFEAGAKKAVVPQTKMASTWCAFGAGAADILHVYEIVDIIAEPFDFTLFSQHLAALEAQADARFDHEKSATAGKISYRFSISLRHKGQINEVEIFLSGEHMTASDIAQLKNEFYRRYEQLYGAGSYYRKAVLEAVTFRLRAVVETPKPHLAQNLTLSGDIPAGVLLGSRPVYWDSLGRSVDTPVYNAELLISGNIIEGPAILETVDTTIVLHPRRRALIDPYGNVEITQI